MIVVGIDPGKITGFAIWDHQNQKFEWVGSGSIFRVHALLLDELIDCAGGARIDLVRLEDARLRKWIPRDNGARAQGAGAVKAHCVAWEDELRHLGIPCELVAPKHNNTKTTSEQFKILTGWASPTNEHARDAAMLVYGFTGRNVAQTLKILEVGCDI